MSFYDQAPSWSQQPARQTSWEQQQQQQQQQQAPPSRSGSVSASVSGMASPPPLPADAHGAFSAQFEEIDRATDNLTKGGKWFPGALHNASSLSGAAAPRSRHEASAAAMGRGYDGNYSGGGGGGGGGDARMGHGAQAGSRNGSVSEYDGGRSNSASSGLQGFYQGQRFPGPRQSEAEQMLQAKRRMAAQRERELRNYHQEQQYNRNVSGVKSSSSSASASASGANPADRAMSPSTHAPGGMTEEDRRELIARQHRALYGDTSTLYSPGSETASASSPLGQPRRDSSSQDVRVASAASNARGASPMAYGDPFGVPSASSTDGGASVTMPPRDNASPAAAAETISTASQSPPSSLQGQKGGVAPIGTRPPPGVGPQGMVGGKRSTTPLTPSSLSYGFSSSEQQGQQPQVPASREERGSVSAASYGGGWGMGGKGQGQGMQASVWG